MGPETIWNMKITQAQLTILNSPMDKKYIDCAPNKPI